MAHYISGGTEVVPMMTLGKLREGCLIELSRLPELSQIALDGDIPRIGAAVSLARLEQDAGVRRHWRALAEAAGSIREPQVRNRGTIGGNVSHGVPSADLVPALLAFDAEISLAGTAGPRCLALADFVLGPYRTALGPDELVVEIRLPAPDPACGSAFQKLTKFGGSGLSVATAAATVTLATGRISHARIAIGSAGPVPRRIAAAEAILIGQAPEEALFLRAGQIAADAAEPRGGSIRATPEHRRRVLVTLVARALSDAAARSAAQTAGASS